MPRINLLPWREEQRKERKLAFMVALGGGTVAAAVATFARLPAVRLDDRRRRMARNEMLRAEIKQLDKQIEEINNLESAKQKFIARMEIIEKLQRSRPEIVHLFDEIVRTLPEGVYLTARQADGQAPEVRRRRAVEHARVRVHAQHRWLRVAAQSGARSRRDQAGQSAPARASRCSPTR